jgi:uncharacterized protein (TIGR02246 family)
LLPFNTALGETNLYPLPLYTEIYISQRAALAIDLAPELAVKAARLSLSHADYSGTSLERSICMKRILVAAVIMVAAVSFVFSHTTRSSARQKGDDEQAVKKLLDELAAAVGKNDTAALDRIYADDYTIVTDTGGVMTKAERLAAMKSGDLKYESVTFDDVNIRVYGNTAVATLRTTGKGQYKGQDISSQARATLAFVKMKGRWQEVAAHTTRIVQQ